MQTKNSLEGKFVNLMVDWAFKRAFGKPENKHLLIEFINDFFEGEKRINDINYLSPEILRRDENDRGCFIDILCEDENQEKYIIEMQVAQQKDFIKRVFYYAARVMAEGMDKGSNDWSRVKGVYCICLMDFRVNYHLEPRTEVYLTDDYGNKDKYDFFKMVFVQLPRYKIKSLKDACNNYEKWLYLLKNAKDMNDYPIDLEKEKAAMRELLEIARTQRLTSAERMEYLDRAKQYDYYIGGLEFRYEEGKEEGLKQGLQQGREEGLKAGANEATIKIAKSMKAKGIDFQSIAECTGLTPIEIESL